MITDKKANSLDYKQRAKEIRKLKKDGWVSSVKIARMEEFREIPMRKLRELCKKSDKFIALRINVSGTTKLWYRESDLNAMLEEIKNGVKG